MAPNRLSTQVEALVKSGAQVTGTDFLLYYSPVAASAWCYRPLPTDFKWVAGGTLLYRRDAWERNPFPELDSGEDTAFVLRFPAQHIHVMDSAPFYVAVIHDGNASPKHFADPRWQRIPLEEVTALLGRDNGFYVTLRGGPHPGTLAAHRRPTTITLA